jgi:outer membrane receptor protein involved in Fe transport
MLKNNKLAKSIKLALVFGAASTTILASNSAIAEEAAEEVETIEVTGSRIKRTDMETPVPVTIIGRVDIAEMGALNVADVLNTSPVSIASSDQSNTAFTNTSVGFITTLLRALGQERTLILVNGRRFVSGATPQTGYAVDLNAIPASMIERIEILKSASSAVYGSDAVAGVINIITRSDFDGLEVNAQSGTSSRGDRNKKSLNITGGGTWDSGSAIFAVGYDNDEGLKSLDRKFSELDQAITLDDNGDEQVVDFFSSYPPSGRIGGYNSDGSTFDFAHELGKDRFNRASYRQLVTPLERKYAAFTLHQEINEDVSYFGEVNFNSARTYGSTIEPTPFRTNSVFQPARGGTGGISMRNPMIPQALRDNLLADGLTLDDNMPEMVRRMVELGARSTDLERETIRIVNGIDWQINDSWAFNGYVSWGKTAQTQENGGQVNVERAENAFDVDFNSDGQLQCADELARIQGCAPLNLFGAGSISAEAARYVTAPAKSLGKVEQLVVSASVSGELPIELPGGNIQVAFGYEHRLEEGQFAPGAFAQVGATSSNSTLATDGSFTTDDIFVEAVLPILDNLELDLAARLSDHSITDEDSTWNIGLQYTPIEGLMVRASAATAIRTPNVSELFGGRGDTFAQATDPCSGVTAAGGSQSHNNCLTIPEIAARVARDGSFELTQQELQSTGGTIGGDPTVNPETSDSFSAGFVWQIMDGLSMTADYYDVKVEDAIFTTTRTTVARRCYDVPASEFDAQCNGAMLRDVRGALTEVHSGTSNENDLETDGYDIELNYTADFGPGTFGVDVIYNHVNEWVQTAIEDGTAEDLGGEAIYPDNRANINLRYALDDLAFSWRMRWIGSTNDSNTEGGNLNFTTGADLTSKFNKFDSEVYHDVSATYFMNETITGTLTVRNLFDTQPQVANQSFKNGSTGINTISEIFDVTGTYFQASVTMKF